ncbi:MAG: hypothetical protein WAM66_02775 [Acidobacteriaceae bacterium]
MASEMMVASESPLSPFEFSANAAWCAGELFEYLQANRVLTVISRPEIEWDAVAVLLVTA